MSPDIFIFNSEVIQQGIYGDFEHTLAYGLYIFAFGKTTSSSHIFIRPLSLGPDRFSKKHCPGGGGRRGMSDFPLPRG